MSSANYFNMFPHNVWGGHADVTVLPDGMLQYILYFHPFDGHADRTMIVDPSNEEHMRAVQQLHLKPVVRE